MGITRADVAPKRPTLERALGAAGSFALALVSLTAILVPGWRASVGRRAEQAIGVESFLVLMMLYIARVSAIPNARGFGRALQVVAMGWYAFAFCLVLGLIGWFSGNWWPLVAGATLLASRAHTLLARRELAQREALFFHALVDLGLLWVCAIASFPLSRLAGDSTGILGWTLVYFTAAGLFDLFGVLVPEPQASAAPRWRHLFAGAARAAGDVEGK